MKILLLKLFFAILVSTLSANEPAKLDTSFLDEPTKLDTSFLDKIQIPKGYEEVFVFMEILAGDSRIKAARKLKEIKNIHKHFSGFYFVTFIGTRSNRFTPADFESAKLIYEIAKFNNID
jgi:hypothetical protein